MMTLHASGARLRPGQFCTCDAADEPHGHRWQITCPLCGFAQECQGARTYELVPHAMVSRDGDPEDQDVAAREAARLDGFEPPCMGSGFRVTAMLDVVPLEVIVRDGVRLVPEA